MIQYYLYELSEPCPLLDFTDALMTMKEHILGMEQWDSLHGTMFVEEENDVSIQQFLQAIIQDFSYTIRVMRTYADNSFTRHLMTQSKCSGLFQDSDALLMALIKQDKITISLLRHELQYLTREDFETIHAYLSADLNAKKTSDYMYLHRNTLNYRLQRILDKSGFDIRYYHQAMIIQQYMQVTST